MTDTTRPKKDERRAAIVAIAREAFLHDGYAATSMSKIAASVGGSKATLYNYFPSKKELFFAVVDRESTETLGHLYDCVEEQPFDIHQALRTFGRRFVKAILSDDLIAFNRMVVAESVRFPEVGQAMYELGFKRGIDQMRDLIRRGMSVSVFRQADARQAAEFLLTMCAGHLHDLKTWNIDTPITPEDIERQIEHATNAFLAFYGNDETARVARTYTGL